MNRPPAAALAFFNSLRVSRQSGHRHSRSPQAHRCRRHHRVGALIEAVKIARETANSIEAVDRKAGEAVFGYLFR